MSTYEPNLQTAPGDCSAGRGGPGTVAIIVDEPNLQALLNRHLEDADYLCWCASDGQLALKRILRDPPDLILLDLMLPRHSGTGLLTELRRESAASAIPVIVLTERTHESNELVGFALGADDLLSKPFSIQLLLARVRAVLRRANRPNPDGSRLSIGPFTLSKERNEVTVGDEPVPLTRTEFQLLKEVLAAAGRVARRDLLIERVFETTDIADRRIDVHMTNLRRKLGSAAPWIQTIRGVGFACRNPAQTATEHLRRDATANPVKGTRPY